MAFHFSAGDITEMQTRWTDGPYKIDGDAFLNSENIVERVIIFSDEYVSAGALSELVTSEDAQYWNFLNRAYCAALRYLIVGGDTFGDNIRTLILAQILEADVNVQNWAFKDHNTDPQRVFFAAEWVTKILYCYDYCIDKFSAGEQTNVEAWLLGAAQYFDDNVHEVLKARFASRRSRDYTPVPGSSADTGSFTATDKTHWNSSGVAQNQIYHSAKQYNNRAATQMMCAGVVGAYLNNATLIDRSKMYFEEWLQFGVYPDGTQAEYHRNYINNNGNKFTGTFYYGAINIDSCIHAADAFNRIADDGLYTYATTGGLFSSTDGATSKNLKLVIDTNVSIINQNVDWYMNSVTTSAFHLDTYDAASNRMIVGDTTFALANKFYADSDLIDCYRREAIQSPPLAGHNSLAETYKGSRYVGHAGWWWGHGGPSVLTISPLLLWDNEVPDPIPPDPGEPIIKYRYRASNRPGGLGIFGKVVFGQIGEGADPLFFEELFVDWAAADVPDDWQKIGTHDVTQGVKQGVSNDGMIVFSDGGIQEIKLATADSGLVASTLYYFEVDVTVVTTGGIVFTDGNSVTHSYSTTGKKTGSFTQSGITTMRFKRDAAVNGGVCDVVVQSLKVDTTEI